MNDLFQLPKDPYDDLGFLFWQIMKAWQRAKHKLLDEFNLTPSQLEVLSAIHHLTLLNEEVNQVAISHLINVDPMTTSSILKKLEKKELITRKPSSSDTRARIVDMTKIGNNLLVKAVTKMKKSGDQIFSSVDEQLLKREFKILLTVLDKINN